MRALCTLGVFLCLASGTIRAEDVAVVAAALKDEAAECRYLRTLCDRLENAERSVDVLKPKHSGATEGELRTAEAALWHVARAMGDFKRAVDVVAAKRGKPVRCPGNACLTTSPKP